MLHRGIFLVLSLLPPIAIALFEFICTEEGLFKPYIHVYKGRRGIKIHSSGPGFFDLQGQTDLYICINGPAFLYFTISYKEGEVFDKPEYQVYAHICSTYNKSPKRGHNHPAEVKKLHGVLLMGDPEDYRLPFTQLFTAPHLVNDKYVNGTSIIVFGDEKCRIQKNGVNLTVEPQPSDKSKPSYCYRLYGDSGANEDEEKMLKADAIISVAGCDPKPNDTAVAGATPGGEQSGAGAQPPPAPEPAPSPTPPEERKRRDTLDERIIPQHLRWNFPLAIEDSSDARESLLTLLRYKRNPQDDPPEPAPAPPPPEPAPAPPPPAEAAPANSPPSPDPAKPSKTEPPPGPPEICPAKQKPKADASNCPPDKCQACPDGTIPPCSTCKEIPPGESHFKLTKCQVLPTVEDECQKGKPNKEYSCNLFQTMIGTKEAEWAETDKWREPIIEKVSEIFVKICNQVPSRFPKLISKLMQFYVATGIKGDPTQVPPREPVKAQPERESWKFIKDELDRCGNRSRSLVFVKQGTTGTGGHEKSNYVYMHGGTVATPISHYIEEADNEYAFNWAIDMHWKIFATVMGICTPTSNPKKSLSSRFFSLYVEDILSPTSEDWIRFKDNLIFQFILGEFYHGETESWINNCMEASYVESNSGSYRPLRPILVNDLREDNYFIESKRRRKK